MIKVKHKLFFSFILFSSFFLFSTIIGIWLNNKKDTISEELRALDDIYILSLKDFKIQQEFLTYETINPLFFKTCHSAKMDQHRVIFTDILNKVNRLGRNHEKKLSSPFFLQKFRTEFYNYQNTLDQVITLLLQRGFKDYGIEGEMRDYAHALMDIKELDQVNILMLRRHEKDFIIRKENQYVIKYNAVIEKVKQEIQSSNKIPFKQKPRIDSIVNGYSNSFAKLVTLEKALGLKEEKSGLMLKLSQHNNTIESLIDVQKKNAYVAEKKIFKELLWTEILILICICILSFVMSYWLAVALTKPLVNLNNYIKEYVSGNFAPPAKLQHRKSKDEISILMDNFYKMVDEISNYINYFKEKVEERTAEINKQNGEIMYQKKKIIEQRDELLVKTQILEVQQKLVTDKNTNIIDSIRYAERIQQTILPQTKLIKKALPDSFIYFQPRDIVSGDFYFIHEKNDKVLFAVADCTGHGVPGAFVSIVGHNAISRAVNEFGLEQPAAILDKLNSLLEESFSNKQNDNEIHDGMDIAFCCLDLQNMQLEYAGANNALWIIENSFSDSYQEIPMGAESLLLEREVKQQFTLKETKANKQPIGLFDRRKPFTNHTIPLQSGDTIYIFSDGYADQFGGPDGKKFKYAKLKELLLSIQNEPMSKQKQLLHEAIEIWKGSQEQVDDICVIGVRV